MSNYPNESECIGILKNAGCTKRVIIHCCTVRTVAEQMLKSLVRRSVKMDFRGHRIELIREE